MIEFLKGGKILNGVSMGMTLDEVIIILGEPNSSFGTNLSGYYHYGCYRYGYNNGIIQEMAIIFRDIEKPLEFSDLEYGSNDVSLYESFKIGAETKMHVMMSFVNHLQLNWNAKNGLAKDHMTVKIENGPFVRFDLYDGTVDVISVVNGFQGV